MTGCESVFVFESLRSVEDGTTQRRYIRCQRTETHDKHFASWGGSQSWRQAEWTDDQGIALFEVPKGKRVW